MNGNDSLDLQFSVEIPYVQRLWDCKVDHLEVSCLKMSQSGGLNVLAIISTFKLSAVDAMKGIPVPSLHNSEDELFGK